MVWFSPVRPPLGPPLRYTEFSLGWREVLTGGGEVEWQVPKPQCFGLTLRFDFQGWLGVFPSSAARPCLGGTDISNMREGVPLWLKQRVSGGRGGPTWNGLYYKLGSICTFIQRTLAPGLGDPRTRHQSDTRAFKYIGFLSCSVFELCTSLCL